MSDPLTVLVTGSDGFIGRHLVPYLATHGYKVIAASRSASTEGPNITAAALPDPGYHVHPPNLFEFTLSALALAASPVGREPISLSPLPLIPTPGR